MGNNYSVYTDGSCLSNPGVGGYAAFIINSSSTHELMGGWLHATNNQMEMMAAIAALEHLHDHGRFGVTIYSDSRYLVKGATKWVYQWMQYGWLTAAGNPVLNRDLWERILDMDRYHHVTWKWVRGHRDDRWNNRADAAAKVAAALTRKYNKAWQEVYPMRRIEAF